MKKQSIFFLLFIFFTQMTFSLSNDDFIGYWKIPSGKSIIKIVKENNEFVGYVVWLKEPFYRKGDKEAGKEKHDRNNPDEHFRDRKVIGIKVAGDLVHDTNTKLKNGWVYDPFNGKKYVGTAEIINKNTVRLRGSIDKKSIIGYTQECKKINPKDYGITF